MSKVTGVVSWHGDSKFGGQSIKLEDGVYYNSKFDIKCGVGDTVEFDNGGAGKKYCQKLRVVAAGGTSASGGTQAQPAINTGRDRSIIRQNSLAHATNVVLQLADKTLLTDAADMIIETARKFEAYSSGDLDKTEEGFNPEQFTSDKEFV